jgi:hypothetical protein
MSACERCGASDELQLIAGQTHGCMNGSECPSPTASHVSSEPVGGVWICHSYDMGPTQVRAFATEIAALRASQEGGYFQDVKFLPFGEVLT